MSVRVLSSSQAGRAPTASPPTAARGAPARPPQVLGNHQLRRLLAAGEVRAHLRVSQPGDALEQEAERVAAAIVAAPPVSAAQPAAGPPSIQRMCRGCDEEQLHRAVSAGAPARTDAAESGLGDALTGGRPLPARSRSFFEPRLGASLEHVRVHTDPAAQEMAGAIGARAFTFGAHVAFAPGEFAPETAGGRHLLGHELVHVLQGGSAIRRTIDPATCDAPAVSLIQPAIDTAGQWLGAVSRWFDAHLRLLRALAPRDGRSLPIGSAAFAQLQLLEQHFGIGEEVRRQGGFFPRLATDPVTVADVEALARATFSLRRHFADVPPDSVDYSCEPQAPRRRRGDRIVEVWGRTPVPGGQQSILFMDAFRDRLDGPARAAVVLHEAFHAWFADFDHDAYSWGGGGYPGTQPFTNADSYATFASIVATGMTYRVIRAPAIEIRGTVPTGPEP